LNFWKKKNKSEIFLRIKLKRKLGKSKGKRGENLSKKGIRVWGDKGRGERKRKGAFWLSLLLCWERRLTDFLVGVGKPQHVLSGSVTVGCTSYFHMKEERIVEDVDPEWGA
jgi:hypothetical protein